MAFGDVLAGLAEASHQHKRPLLEMGHQDRVAKANLFGQLASNPNFSPEQQEWFAKGAIAHLTDEKAAKEWEVKNGNIQVPVEILAKPPAAQPPLPAVQTGPLQGQGIQAPNIPPPLPPPGMTETVMRSPFQPMSGVEKAERGIQAAEPMRAFLAQHGIEEPQAAMLSVGKTPPGASMVPGEVNGNDLPANITTDAYGTPIDRTGGQFYRQEYNKWGQPTGKVFPSITPPQRVQSSIAISPADFAQRRAQGEPFNDQNGTPITEVGPTEALYHVAGPGVPPNTYFKGSQRIATTTADNLVQTRGVFNQAPTGVVGVAQPPT